MNDIKKIKKVKPLFDRVITTAYQEKTNKSGIITVNMERANTSMFQEVLAVGDTVEKTSPDIKPGAIVHINPAAYGKPKYKENSLKDGIIEENFMVEYNLPTVEINGCKCLFLTNRDIDYIVQDFE